MLHHEMETAWFVFAVVTALGVAVFVTAWALGRLPSPHRRDQAGTTSNPGLVELAERVGSLERAFPAWQLEMSKLAELCMDSAEEADRKKRAAYMRERRARDREEDEQQQPIPGALPPPVDDAEARARVLALARARRGGARA